MENNEELITYEQKLAYIQNVRDRLVIEWQEAASIPNKVFLDQEKFIHDKIGKKTASAECYDLEGSYEQKLSQIVDFVEHDDARRFKKEVNLLLKNTDLNMPTKVELAPVNQAPEMQINYWQLISKWRMESFIKRQEMRNRKTIYQQFEEQLLWMEDNYPKMLKHSEAVQEKIVKTRKHLESLKELELLIAETSNPSVFSAQANLGFKKIRDKFVERYFFSEYMEEILIAFKVIIDEEDLGTNFSTDNLGKIMGQVKQVSTTVTVKEVAETLPIKEKYQSVINAIQNLLTEIESECEKKQLVPAKHYRPVWDIIYYSLKYFTRPNIKNEEARRAFICLHLELVRMETVKNWEANERAFSEISSNNLKKELKNNQQEISNRMIVLYICYQLKMTVEEVNDFLWHNQLSTKLYVLDVQEIVVLSALNYTPLSQDTLEQSFHSVLSLAQEIEEMVTNAFMDYLMKRFSTYSENKDQFDTKVNNLRMINMGEYYTTLFENLSLEEIGNELRYCQGQIEADLDTKYQDGKQKRTTWDCTTIVEEWLNNKAKNSMWFSSFPNQKEPLKVWKSRIESWVLDNQLLFFQAYSKKVTNIVMLVEKQTSVLEKHEDDLAATFYYRYLLINSQNGIIAPMSNGQSKQTPVEKSRFLEVLSLKEVRELKDIGKSEKLNFNNYATKSFSRYFHDLLNPKKEIQRKIMIQLILMSYLEGATVGKVNLELGNLHYDLLNPALKEDLLLILFLELNKQRNFTSDDFLRNLWLLDYFIVNEVAFKNVEKKESIRKKRDKKRIMYNSNFLWRADKASTDRQRRASDDREK